MAEQRCPDCGEPLPQQLGQHSLAPTAGLVECPNCGANVTLDRPRTSGDEEGESGDYFAGEETVAGVMEEIERKEEQ